MNTTDTTLTDLYDSLRPLGYTQRYVLNLKETEKKVKAVNLFTDHTENNEFECFMDGGVEFPVLNWEKADGLPYDHFWSGGFGAIFPDRLYHVQWSRFR